MDIDNRSLVEECMKGDREALNLFYTRFAPRMLRLIHRYVTDEKDAEDILHDGFIVAFTRLGTLHDHERVDYWLATIMKNLSLQFLHTQDVAVILHELPEVEDSGDIQDVLDLEVLESLILRLPAGYQKVFRLAVLENKSHKEIARLLGIAPNTSSSQLFHAKMMMRRLISEYRAQAGVLSLLIAALSAGLLFMKGPDMQLSAPRQLIVRNSDRPAPVLPEDSTASGTSEPEAAASPAKPVSPPKNAVAAAVVAVSDSVPDITGAVAESTETPAPQKTDGSAPYRSDSVTTMPDEPYYAQVDDYTPERRKDTEWSFGLGVNPGLLNFDNIAAAQDNKNDFNPSEPPDNPGTDPDDKDDKKEPATRSGAPDRYNDYRGVPHHNYMPVSFSLTARKSISKTLGIETGLTYTYLHTRFEGIHSRSECHWHYLGIPLKLNMRAFSAGSFRMYASFGGKLDIPLYSNADVSVISGTNDLRPGSFSSPAVWSLSASYGISFRLSDRVDIFIEPTLQYHFEHDHEVPNMWTDNPWGFSLPIGIRLNW